MQEHIRLLRQCQTRVELECAVEAILEERGELEQALYESFDETASRVYEYDPELAALLSYASKLWPWLGEAEYSLA